MGDFHEGFNMTDLIQKIESYMQANPYCSRAQIIKALGTSLHMLNKLEKQGVKLPLKQSSSIGATKSRKMALKAGRNFVIRRTRG